MRTRIVRIGNAQAVRIPKRLMEQTGLSGEVEITAKDDALIITPARHPRQGWEEAFARMAEIGDDKLLDEVAPATRWDEDQWQW